MDLLDIYNYTLPILATENLIMGATLLILQYSNKPWKNDHIEKNRHRKGFSFLAIAMLMMAMVNFAEPFSPLSTNMYHAISYVIPAASIQLFLLLQAYGSLLSKSFVTCKRIIFQLLMITIFTMPPLLIDAQSNPALFYICLYISIVFYAIKYILSMAIFRKLYNQAKNNLYNYYSDNEAINTLNWVNSTFYTIVVIGTVSIFIPMTNYIGLIIFQVFLFFAYFYIYWEAILNTMSFNSHIQSTIDIDEQECATAQIDSRPITEAKSVREQRMLLLEKWIATRQYAKRGIVIDDVAAYLRTNRTTLSLYLNSELGISFYDWVSKIRIESAKEQLINYPMLPIIEIAISVGIEDRSNFDKLFKRMMGGISPAAYRIKHAKAQTYNNDIKSYK